MIKIAIVDDETQITVMLQKALSKNKDFSLTTFNNPLEALRVLPSNPADVVLLDIMMPQKDGLEVLDELCEKCPSSKVVMMTAYSTLDRVLASHKKGAEHYLLKPFESLNAVEKLILELVK